MEVLFIQKKEKIKYGKTREELLNVLIVVLSMKDLQEQRQDVVNVCINIGNGMRLKK